MSSTLTPQQNRWQPLEARTAAVSLNSNSFGLHSHIFVTENGEVWEALRTGQFKLQEGDPLRLRREVLQEDGRPGLSQPSRIGNWAELSFEIPRYLGPATGALMERYFPAASPVV